MALNNRLQLTRVDHFDCSHVVTTFQYGAHPARVYAFCPFCKQVALLDWKDPIARTWNRIFSGIPYMFTALITIATAIGLIIWLLKV